MVMLETMDTCPASASRTNSLERNRRSRTVNHAMSRITVALHQQCRDKTCTWLFGGAKRCLRPGTPDRIGHEHRAPRHPGADSQRPPDRELIWQDPHRPRYHLTPPEGFFNDPNGALFWNGRYHLFYLAREPIPHPGRPGEELWVAVWDHVSSRDLVHWIQHPPAIRPKPDGSTPRGIYSGGAIKNAPRPALIITCRGRAPASRSPRTTT